MAETLPRRRRVVVVGASGRLDVAAVAEKALARSEQLVLITVGYPIPPEHTRIVNEALRLADEWRVPLDASLVLDHQPLRYQGAEFEGLSEEMS